MRVQSIIRELRGEKIDIIEYSDDPVLYATKALSPAKIARVTIVDAPERQMEVVVDDLQLSLAIGKRGQNVRLAAKLTGWKIDIKSEEEKRREVETQMQDLVISGAPLSVLMDHGLSEAIAELLVGAGVGTVERLGSMTPEELEAIAGIDAATVGEIQTAVMSFYGQFEQQVEEEAGAVEVEAAAEVEAEAAMVAEGGAPAAVSENDDSSSEEVATGVLERDMARHEVAAVEDGPSGKVLDLGNVEGLSAAPSTLDHQPGPDEIAEKHESGTMKGAE